MSRRYGYYGCNCGRTWRSAYTWCPPGEYTPEYSQDCQRCHESVFAYRVEPLKVPDERRNDDLSKNHNQALCHKCRYQPYPCSSRMNYYRGSIRDKMVSNNSSTNRMNYNHNFSGSDNDNGFELSDQDNDEESEDDDLSLKANNNTFEQDDDLQIAIKNSFLRIQNQNKNTANQNNNENILDLCSSDSDNDDDDIESVYSNSVMSNINTNEHECTQYTQFTQYTEPQSAIELIPNNFENTNISNKNQYECTQYTQYTQCTQYTEPQSAYICNRNTNKNIRKRSRNEMQFNDAHQIQPELDEFGLTPVKKRQKISSHNHTNETIQSIATKYGWHEINSTNMISFKKANQRLNVWVKKCGLYSMRIQPMECSKKNISLKTFEETLSNLSGNNKNTLTQAMRDRIEANRKAALERRKARIESLSQNSQSYVITEAQKRMIEMNRQAALKRRKAWIQNQTQNNQTQNTQKNEL